MLIQLTRQNPLGPQADDEGGVNVGPLQKTDRKVRQAAASIKCVQINGASSETLRAPTARQCGSSPRKPVQKLPEQVVQLRELLLGHHGNQVGL